VSPGILEPTLKYHPSLVWSLTWKRGHCLVGSLTGVVASKKVSEAFKGPLSTPGNRALECNRRSGLDCETHKSNRCESRR
jgi:hypothetical protein